MGILHILAVSYGG